jgi:hypothetical protein
MSGPHALSLAEYHLKRWSESMTGIYDTNWLLAQVRLLRAAAETASPDERNTLLSTAADYETLVERSINTPVIKDRHQSAEVPARQMALVF